MIFYNCAQSFFNSWTRRKIGSPKRYNSQPIYCRPQANIRFIVTMSSYFRITLMRSGIGLPKRTQGVLKALGLRQRMKTVFYPVSPEVAGQIMKVKELVSVREVDRALTKEELKAERKPDPGYYMESAVPR
jgi:large subunit ribosomal protein L30